AEARAARSTWSRRTASLGVGMDCSAIQSNPLCKRPAQIPTTLSAFSQFAWSYGLWVICLCLGQERLGQLDPICRPHRQQRVIEIVIGIMQLARAHAVITGNAVIPVTIA